MPGIPVIRFSLKNATLVRKGLENLRKKIPLISKSRMRAMTIEIRDIMRKAGKKRPAWNGSSYINWDSKRQRRAYFASDGFGGGIPSRRKGVHKKGWKVQATRDGYDVSNTVDTSKYLYGTARSRKQSKIHVGYWPVFLDVVGKIVNKLPKSVKEHLVQTAKQLGFEAK